MDVHRELRVIHDEYKLYFAECSLHLQSNLALPGDDDMFARALRRKTLVSHIRIKTGEENTHCITVCVAGWHEVGQTEYHPTFEALLNKLSPSFRNRFASELTEKLKGLS